MWPLLVRDSGFDHNAANRYCLCTPRPSPRSRLNVAQHAVTAPRISPLVDSSSSRARATGRTITRRHDKKMEIGIHIPQVGPPASIDNITSFAKCADDAGFDGLW